MSKSIKLNDTNYNGVSTVQLPTTDGGTATFKDTDEITVPTGTKTITENGTYDVSGYASAEVSVESESGESSEEFVGIKLFGFENNAYYGQPTVADLRSLQSVVDASIEGNGVNPLFGLAQMFANTSVNASGGLFVKLTDIYLPDGLLQIGNNAFAFCCSLKNIHGDLSGVTSIGQNAFSSCSSLTEIPYMPNVDFIGPSAFIKCTGLTQVKFYKTPTQGIQGTSFNNCTNITDIYVPWAEGEVANAPWGAPTTATIHYNTTYDENHNPIV